MLLSGGSELRWVMQTEQGTRKFPLSYHHEVFLDAGRVEMLMSVLQFSYFYPTLHLPTSWGMICSLLFHVI